MGLDAVIYDQKEERQLACKRLGNVSQVAFLRESASRILGAQSLVVSRVLYDATHSGDSLTTAYRRAGFRSRHAGVGSHCHTL